MMECEARLGAAGIWLCNDAGRAMGPEITPGRVTRLFQGAPSFAADKVPARANIVTATKTPAGRSTDTAFGVAPGKSDIQSDPKHLAWGILGGNAERSHAMKDTRVLH